MDLQNPNSLVETVLGMAEEMRGTPTPHRLKVVGGAWSCIAAMGLTYLVLLRSSPALASGGILGKGKELVRDAPCRQDKKVLRSGGADRMLLPTARVQERPLTFMKLLIGLKSIFRDGPEGSVHYGARLVNCLSKSSWTPLEE